jgi:hypothetical protein
MDGGSSLNIIYAETLGLLQIDLSSIRAGTTPFHGIIPGKRVQPLGQLDLPVCFGTPSNFRRETVTFEVVGFRETYHAVLGRPCYTGIQGAITNETPVPPPQVQTTPHIGGPAGRRNPRRLTTARSGSSNSSPSSAWLGDASSAKLEDGFHPQKLEEAGRQPTRRQAPARLALRPSKDDEDP